LLRLAGSIAIAAASLAPSIVAASTVEVEWDRFRHYVAAHVWVADIDFRDGEVSGLHVCGGFNAFRESEQLAALGFAEMTDPDPRLQAAAFAITINTSLAIEKGRESLQEILGSSDYGKLTGDARLRYVRREMWEKIANDPEVERAVRETISRVERITASLARAGLLEDTGETADPMVYTGVMNIFLQNPETLDAVLGEPTLAGLDEADDRRAWFAAELARRVAEARVGDPEQREAYRRDLEGNLVDLLGAGGTLVVRLVDR
jgi:hypothetical protein